MRKLSRSVLSLVLSITVALSMCTFFQTEAYAVPASTVGNTAMQTSNAVKYLSSGSTISLLNYNTAAGKSTVYQNNSDGWQHYYLKMPMKGTVEVIYNTDYVYVGNSDLEGAGVSYCNYFDSGTVRTMYYTVSQAGTLDLWVYSYAAGSRFQVFYDPASCTVSAPKGKFSPAPGYAIGAASSSSVSTFAINAPGTGYLEVYVKDAYSGRQNVYVRTAGFSGYQNLYNKTNIKVGVKKGKYTFQIKGAQSYYVRAKFVPVTESSCKTTKKSAAKLVKGKAQKGLIFTNAKKVHWYKIKNKKKQKLTITFNANHMSAGNASTSSSYIKITCIFPKGKTKRTATIRPGQSADFTIINDKIGGQKAKKGTYYLQIQSYGGANGYYAIKWK